MSKQNLVERATEKAIRLYNAQPLRLSTDHAPKSWIPKSKDKRGQYDEVLHMCFYRYFVETVDEFNNIGSWRRRSLEDLFLICKHYIEKATISEIAEFSEDLMSSNYCFDTGLRVYRDPDFFSRMHYGNGRYSNKFLSSFWINTDNHYEEEDCADSYDELVEILKEADKCAREHPNFAPVGRGYPPKESTPSRSTENSQPQV